MRQTQESIHLECLLSDKEKLDYSKQLSEAVSKKARQEETLKSMQTQIKAEIVACEGTINSLADKINTGREFREVPCEIRYEFKKKRKITVRMDTGEIVKERPIEPEEMQEELTQPKK